MSHSDRAAETVPLSEVSEGDEIHVEYDSHKSPDDQERRGKVTDVDRYEDTDGLDTVTFVAMKRECRLKVSRSGYHTLEQKRNQWTELGRTTAVAVFSDADA